MKLISARCPDCGANIKVQGEEEKVQCEFCKHTIIVKDAIATYKLKVDVKGSVSVDGVETNQDLIDSANELMGMNEYLKAKKKFMEFSEKCPDNYQGWLGLLICRTRNFTIRDNNIMFENDVNNYYNHFLRVAPENVKKQYNKTIEHYLYPDKIITDEKEIDEPKTNYEEKTEKEEKDTKKSINKDNKIKGNIKVGNGIKDLLCYVMAFFSFIFFAATASDGMIFSSLLWISTLLIYIPPVFNKINIKINLSHGKIVLLRILLPFIAFISIGFY